MNRDNYFLSHCALPRDKVGNSYTSCGVWHLHYFYLKTILHCIEPNPWPVERVA